MKKVNRPRVWQPSRIYGFVRARQLDGTLDKGPKLGSYVLTAMRVSAGWGWVSEKRWSYPKPVVWPPTEPEGLDRIARFNRTVAHFRVRTLFDARTLLAQRFPVQVSVPIHPDWRTAPNGLIRMPQPSELWTGQHSVLIIDYHDGDQLLTFMNSWGRGWGDRGFGHLPYEYFSRFSQEAWYIEWGLRFSSRLRDLRGRDAFAIVEQRFQNSLGYDSVVIDQWDLANDVRVGWCIATIRDEWFEVEDFFIRPDYQRGPHLRKLLSAVSEKSANLELPMRFWIPWADTRYGSSNFGLINDVIRAGKLNVEPSGQLWAPYKAELVQV